MKKPLYYVANIRFPTERAHGIQIMEMCQAFREIGYDVELVVPNRKTPITADPFEHYDIKTRFPVRKLWTIDAVGFGRIGFWLQSVTFALSVFVFAAFREGFFYTRDEIIALELALIDAPTAWEAHMGQRNILVRALIYLGVRFVVITEALKELYIKLGVPAPRILVAPDGADIDRFDIPTTREEARKELGLPMDKRVVLYKGSLEAWKGAGTLAEAARLATARDLEFVFIGGKPEDVESFKREFSDISNLRILGNRPRKETPVYQKAADILVIPNSAKEDISKLYTSPMKLFGYMAGGVPIVASDLPSLREILNEERAYFFAPDNAQSLAHAIDRVEAERPAAEEKARKALEDVREYSWKKRAERIINFVS